MKAVFFVIFVFLGLNSLTAQTSEDFVQTEIKKVETILSKSDAKLILNTIQKDQLATIFKDKFTLVNAVYNRNLSKLDTSNEITKIENEYKDKIENILTFDQRKVFTKIPKQSMLKPASTNN
jgi:hypothetical protein